MNEHSCDHITYTHKCIVCNEPSFTFVEGSHTAGTPYTWTCDRCGAQVKIVFEPNMAYSTQEPTGKRCERTLVLVKFVTAPHIMAVAEGVRWSDRTEESQQYFYNSHTCPVNVLRCEEFIHSGVDDQHGILELIRTIDVTGPNAMDRDEAKNELIKLAKQLQEQNND